MVLTTLPERRKIIIIALFMGTGIIAPQIAKKMYLINDIDL